MVKQPSYHLIARFEHLRVKDAIQEARVKAGNPATAVARGLREILARDGVKGRRHRQIKMVLIREDGRPGTET